MPKEWVHSITTVSYNRKKWLICQIVGSISFPKYYQQIICCRVSAWEMNWLVVRIKMYTEEEAKFKAERSMFDHCIIWQKSSLCLYWFKGGVFYFLTETTGEMVGLYYSLSVYIIMILREKAFMQDICFIFRNLSASVPMKKS